MSNTKPTQSGVATIEFALTSLVWLPLILGTLFYGAELIRAMQAVQVARDTGSMYARGVDFSPTNTNNQALIARLGRELDLRVAGGSGVIILTTIQFISQNECNVLPRTVPCTNILRWVVTQRSTIGNTSLKQSSYTTDPLPNLDASTGKVLSNASPAYPYYLTNSALALNSKFNLINIQTDPSTKLPVTNPATGLPVAFGAGTPVYLVEAYFKSTPVPGFRNNPGLLVVTVF